MPNLPGVSGATKQTHLAVLEIVHQTVWNLVLAMTQNGWPNHFCILRKDELSLEQGCLV